MSFQIGYVASRGTHLLRTREANSALPVIHEDGRKFFPPGLTTRNPVFASDRRASSNGHSWYDGLVFGMTRRMGGGSQIQASYTWSKARDQGSSLVSAQLGGQFAAIDPDDVTRNNGLALFDVRHNFVFNAVYELPWGSSLTGLARALAAGWQVGGIVTLQDGIPFTPTLAFNNSRNLASGSRFEVPDLREGASSNPVLGGYEQYFDVTAFVLPPAGFIGNLGRNTVIGPGLATVDASFVKNTRVSLFGSSDQTFQFRFEVFNLLNRVNLGLPDAGAVINTDGTPNPAAGRIRSTTSAARQMQLGFKFIW
jgi:hypothetical protein